jgi:RHS repeat-associated protein
LYFFKIMIWNCDDHENMEDNQGTKCTLKGGTMGAFTKRVGIVSLLAIVRIVFMLFIIFYLSSMALAVDQTIFGPEKLSIKRWSIHLSSHKFSADEPGEGVLVIAKNTPDKKIRGGFIIFNHETIHLRDFLRESNTVFEKTISLKGRNRVIVFMRGSRGASIMIEVRKKSIAPPPTITFSAEPSSIKLGEPSVLIWNTTDTDSVNIDQNIGGVSLSGFHTVSPLETTTYILTASGPGGDALASVTIEVVPAPLISISADPEIIQAGGSSTLSWSSYNIDKVFIDNGIGTVSAEGSITVSPEHTTTYTITATGTIGSALATATVTVTGNPAQLPEGSFGEQYADLVPPDATVEQYDSKRFSVITGLVQTIDDVPISDVSVTVLGHPEYGTAKTDADGRFSIPIEGGTIMTVTYRKQGLLASQRAVYVPWNDIAITETIKMLGEDLETTAVTFDGNPETVVTHRSTEVSDEFGSRSCTMVFEGDNKAYLLDEEGNDVYELTTITTRVTEYTTPESMPAILPPTSAYTYCAELSVDGAPRVRFEKPVVTWVNNFLGFDVGMVVPVGYYDRDRGIWVPADNGVVVKLLDTDTDGVVDALDADGDDQPDDLNSDESYRDEVKGLNDPGTYAPGATFWRVMVTHITPWDFNWPFGPPLDAIASNAEGAPDVDLQKDEEKDCKNQTGSFVEERSRIFHEDIYVPGTNMNLHYASNRVEGYKTVINVPASGEDVPDSLKSIIVNVNVAGRIFEQILNPLPNQKADFVWDGLDNMGRTVKCPVSAHISVGFVYDSFYYKARADFVRSFAQAGSDMTSVRGRQDLTFWKRSKLDIPNKVIGTIAEGWTLSNYHYVSATEPDILHKGDGSVIRNNAIMIDTVAGNGLEGYRGDGGPATEAWIVPGDIAIDGAGNLYLADGQNDCIRKVDANGIITTVYKWGLNEYRPWAIAIDDTDNIYTIGCHCILKTDTTSGETKRIAGNYYAGYGGDNGPATEAVLNFPSDIAVDAVGNIFIADSSNNRIRKIDTGGIITTVAGTGSNGYSGDGGPATQAQLFFPKHVAVDSAGNLYITDSNHCRIRKVDTSGIITTIAGTGSEGYSGDGGPAIQAQIFGPEDITVDSAGNLYIADTYNRRIRKVDTNGIITTIAGTGSDGYSGDGGPASKAKIGRTFSITLDALGNLYLVDGDTSRIRKVAPHSALAIHLIGEDILFTDDNGLAYILSASGLHKKTIDLDTGITLYEFGYDEENKLISITDRFGSQTTIQRDGEGVPTSITSPDGIITTLNIDANNHLNRITYADGGYYSFEYALDDLLTAKVEPEGNRFEHQFNESGRLTDATDDEGGHWHYERATFANGDILTETTTGEGNPTSYLDHTYSTGRYLSIITDPTGAETLYEQSADGLTVNKILSCGMDLAFTYDLDPEYRFKDVRQMKETTPAFRQRVTERNKTYSDTDSDDIPDRITETVTVNGKETTLEHDIFQSTKIVTSPEGRTVTSYYHPENLLTNRFTIPDLYDTNYGYDARGRLTSRITNTRETSYSYNARGFLESVTDPENHTTTYSYDPVGRITGVSRHDGSSVGFTYDKNGNMTVLSTSSNIDHQFGYNGVNYKSSYVAPISGSYSYVYDRDRRLTQINFPSGNRINNIYDKIRLVQIQTPEGNIDFNYLCSTKVGSIANGTDTVTYGYDGKLITSETSSGTLNTALVYSYDDDFNVTDFTYGGNTESYIYDDDGLLIGAGRFTVDRNAQNGLPESVTGGFLNLGRSFNGYGEVTGQTYSVSSQAIALWDLTRNYNGRITEKTEMVDGTTAKYVYTYDPLGRLRTATRDGTLVEEYRYDPNGTRTYEMNALRGIASRTFAYSDEDHLLTAGTATYQYNPDGFLTTKTDGTEETHYDYSSRGELLGVTLPDGTTIDYIHDPLGRRIAKRVNGTITEKYLWQGLTRLLAVYDGSGNLKMRFEYADSRMPYAMTKNGNIYYLTCDQVGSLRIVADSSGNVVKQIDYDSFGNVIADSNPAFDIPFGFAGGLFDKDTGLIRFGVRDYDPDVGRWTAKDPILFAGGDTDLYGYCLSDPVNWVDPEGHVGIAGVVVGIVAGAYGGFLSGITSGKIEAGIIGGLAGAAAGAVIGAFLPQSSTVLGGMVGGFISGVFGGAVGGATAKALSTPCASSEDIGWAAAKGAGIGALTGYMGGGMVASAAAVGATGIAVHTCAAMFTAPISWGLGMIHF